MLSRSRVPFPLVKDLRCVVPSMMTTVVLEMCPFTKLWCHCFEIHPRRCCWVLKQVQVDVRDSCRWFSELLWMLPLSAVHEGLGSRCSCQYLLLPTFLVFAVWQYKVLSWVDHFSESDFLLSSSSFLFCFLYSLIMGHLWFLDTQILYLLLIYMH